MSQSSRFTLLPILLAPLFVAGCAQKVVPARSEGCDATHAQVIGAVLNDAGLESYGNVYFEGDKKLTVVWQDSTFKVQPCKVGDLTFVVTRSTHPSRGESRRFVLVSKLYYDDDAAYVEIVLDPTGKHGDFFLRNRGGWKVKQRRFYETSTFDDWLREASKRGEEIRPQ